MDFALDADHDLALNDLGQPYLVDGVDYAAQSIRIRLNLHKGEWFLDGRVGVPWMQEILGNKLLTDAALRAIIRGAVLSNPIIGSVQDLRVTWDRARREVDVSFRALTRDGRVVRSDRFPPFILTG